MTVSRLAIRISAFPGKELTEIVRQPALVLALVLGPFLILLLFGATLRDQPPTVHAIFVTPEGSAVADRAQQLAERNLVGTRLRIIDVTADEQAAMQRLRQGDVGLVVVFPGGAEEAIRTNERVPIVVYHNRLDPIETEALTVFTLRLVDEANQQVLAGLIGQLQERTAPVVERTTTTLAQARALREALEAAQRRASDPALLADALQRVRSLENDLGGITEALRLFGELDPQVVVSPFTGSAEQISAAQIRLADFYAPAAVALLLQHLVVTFVSLSMVREEELGTTELFRVSPLSATEALIGRYLAYLTIGAAIGAGVFALLVFALGVPMAGSWWLLALATGMLLFASIGIGVVIALLSASASQAVQYAMIVLLGSMFFSGFLLTLERFAPPLPALARLLPVTYGVELFRDVMLRGAPLDPVRVAGLAAIGALLLAASAVLLNRRMLRA